MNNDTLSKITNELIYFQEWADLQRPFLEEKINELLPNDYLVHEAMRYSTLNGGKRFRALLCLATLKLFKNDVTIGYSLATAIECLHSYSLIHDDLPCMDNDDMRRGQASCHKFYTEDLALLAGDGLQALAFEIITTHLVAKDAVKIKILQQLTHAGLAMVEGQSLDIDSQAIVTLSRLEQVHMLKTGALMKACILSGAILGEATQQQVQQLHVYSKAIGLGFQIGDDILDVTSNTEILGKTAGKDHLQQKKTYIDFFGIEGAKKQLEKMYQEAMDSLTPFEGQKSDEVLLLKGIAAWMLLRSH
jgi:geranylgeranyl pyrophosphate synthase